MRFLIVIMSLSFGLSSGAPAFTQTVAHSWGYEADADKAYLGIYSGRMSEKKAQILGFDNAYGSYISQVIPNSAADQAGLQHFDYVYGIDDARTNKQNDLTDLLEEYDSGDDVTVHFIRKRKKQQVKATLGTRSSWSISKNESEQAFLGISPTDESSDNELGMSVRIISNSTAEAIGLQDRDMILDINGFPIVDWSDITTAINNMNPGEVIEVAYLRQGAKGKAYGKVRSRRQTQGYDETFSYQKRESGFLGIQSNQLSRKKAEKLGFDNAYGSYITKVIPGTAADKAGVEPFDYIYGIDEFRTGEQQDLSAILRRFEAGNEVNLYMVRMENRMTLPVTLGRRSDSEEEERNECDDPFFGVRHDLRNSTELGVGISVVRHSTAEEMGMINGDVITRINNYPIIDWEDIATAINSMKVGEEIRVNYQRNGKRLSGSQPIKSHCDNELDNDYDYDDDTWENRVQVGSRNALSNVLVEIIDLNEADAKKLSQQFRVDMDLDNDLRIEGLNLIPESSSGLFNLEFNLPQRGSTSIRIFNESGRQIYNYDLGNFSGQFTDQVDVSQNGTGDYYLEIRQSGKSVAQKIILSQK